MHCILDDMAEVTVRAVQFVYGIPEGETVTIERDEIVDGLITQGRVEVVGGVESLPVPGDDLFPSDETPPTPTGGDSDVTGGDEGSKTGTRRRPRKPKTPPVTEPVDG